MTHSIRGHRLHAALLLILGLSWGFGVEPSRAAEWDQQTMIAMATEFHEIVKDLRSTVRRSDKPSQPRQDRVRALALETLKKLETAARKLRDELAKGEGRDETYRLMRRIDLLRNDAAVLSRHALIRSEVQAKLAAAAGILQELEFYYVSGDEVSGDDGGGSGDEVSGDD